MRAALVSVLFVLVASGSRTPDRDIVVPKIWRRLGKPKPGEWLALYREPGQNFAEYKAMLPGRSPPSRKVIYIQPWLTRPLPSGAGALMDELARVLAAWFGRQVEILSSAAMPQRAYVADRRQYNVKGLAARLIRTLPEDALLVLAVTDRDLKLPDFDRARGWGGERVAVISTWSLGRDRRLLRRTIALGLHEATHGLGLAHCIFYPCVMNGALRLMEADRRPMQLCPICRKKLCWKLGLDPLARYDRLLAALSAAKLPEAARRTKQARLATEQMLK